MNSRRKLGTLLVCIGVVLLLVSAGALLRTFLVMQPRPTETPHSGDEETPEPPTVTVILSGETMHLGPTAAAAATRLPPPTPIASPGPASERPSAPLRIVSSAVDKTARVVDVGWHLVELGDEVHGAWDTVSGAVGHHRGSADPGQSGNCVLSAHSSVAGGAVFQRLEELSIGDVVGLYTVDGRHCQYTVSSVLLLDEVGATLAEKREHAKWLDPADGSVITLVTCWPPWAYTHRVVVRADLNAP